MRHGVAGGVLSDDLGSVGRGLAGAAEVALTGAGPRDDLTFLVGDRDDGVIEGSENVGVARDDILRTLGLADLDRAEFFFEKIFSGRLLGDSANELNRFVAGSGSSLGSSLGSSFTGDRGSGAFGSRFSGLIGLGALGLFLGGGSSRRAFKGGLGGFFFLRS